MKNTLSKIKKILIQYNHIFFIILVFIGISYVYLIYAPNTMRKVLKYHKYTIASVTSDFHYGNDKGYGYDYVYFVNGKKYSKTVNINSYKGQRCLLIYDSLKPSNQVFLEGYSINDTITAPKNGWKYEQVPIAIDSAEIREYIEKWK